MKRKMTMAAVVLFGVGFSSPALAARADKREDTQQARIVQGAQSGELTRPEAVRLQKQHNRIDREIRRERLDDGRLDAKERAKIEKKQDRLNKRIHKQKHDAQDR